MRRWVKSDSSDGRNSGASAVDCVLQSEISSRFGSNIGDVFGEESQRSLSQKIRSFLGGAIAPSGSVLYYWSMLVSLVFMYNLLFIIGRISFPELQELCPIIWYTLDYVCDTVNIMDIVLHLKKGYREDGIMVTDARSLALNYAKSKQFITDLIAVIPTDMLYIVLGKDAVWLRMNRLVKGQRASAFADIIELKTNSPNFFRAIRLITGILTIFHWNGCFYFLLSRYVGFGNDEFVFRYDRIVDTTYCVELNESDPTICLQRNILLSSNLSKQYIFCLYWSALMLTTIGEQDMPEVISEYMFYTVDLLIGLLIFASIVGNVGTMVSSSNARKSEFQEQIDGAKAYIRNEKVEKKLATKTVKWFDYIWSQKLVLDEEKVLETLPIKLRKELAIQVHLETLKQVPLFQDCDAGLLIELVLKLKLQIFSPGDFICRKGDVGKEMYIIKRGQLQVVSPDCKQVFVTLKEGSVFGELSLLNIPGNKTGNRRSATIRSCGFSDLFVLSKADLLAALREYPRAREILLTKGKEILRRDNLLESKTIDETRADGRSVAQILNLVEERLEKTSAGITELYEEFCASTNLIKKTLTRIEEKARKIESGEI